MHGSVTDLSGFSALKPWLEHTGSFMKRLVNCGVHDAEVIVLKEGWQKPRADEKAILGLAPRRLAWIREVIIQSPNTPWMVARSVLPAQTLAGHFQQLKHLKTRALGTVLFKNKKFQRASYAVRAITPDSIYYPNMPELSGSDKLYLRNSIFTAQEKSLLLTEIFFNSLSKLRLLSHE